MDFLDVNLPAIGLQANVLLLAALGFLVGVLGGFFGIGGGWVLTPALNVFGFPMPFAVGTSLASVTGLSAIAATKHWRLGNVDLRVGAATAVFMVLGTEIGAQAVLYLEAAQAADQVIRACYVLLLAGLGAFMLQDYIRSARRPAGDGLGQEAPCPAGLCARVRWLQAGPAMEMRGTGTRVAVWAIALVGLGTGVMAGVMGVGGGCVLLPAFVYLFGMPAAVAVGTSLSGVLVSAAYGTYSYGMKGRVELYAALAILLGSVVGTHIGVSASQRAKGSSVCGLYAGMLLVASVGVLLRQLGSVTVSAFFILGGAAAVGLVVIVRIFFAHPAPAVPAEAGKPEPQAVEGPKR